MTSVFDHPWLGGLFGDAQMAELWSPQAQLASMRAFEAAWSRALALPESQEAAQVIEKMEFDLDDLRAGMGKDGVVIPRLVAQIKAAAGEAASAVHKGATSQDVMDSATAIAMRDSLTLIEARLLALIAQIAKLDEEFGDRALMGRTRMQAATMITVHDRIAPWAMPLAGHRNRIAEALPRVAQVQIGGASGDRADIKHREEEITNAVATALGLCNPPRAWHAMRDGVAEFAGILAMVSGTLGKMGQDIALMAQQGIDEIKLSGGGASSAMPHKQNPVLAELLVTLARFNAVQLSAVHHSMIHEQERSGAAWALEWMILPQMAQATARALAAALEITKQIKQIG